MEEDSVSSLNRKPVNGTFTRYCSINLSVTRLLKMYRRLALFQESLRRQVPQGQRALGYPADDEPMPIAPREKPQDMLHEGLHTLSDANLLIRFHAHEIPWRSVLQCSPL